jgi:hypothetical protein
MVVWSSRLWNARPSGFLDIVSAETAAFWLIRGFFFGLLLKLTVDILILHGSLYRPILYSIAGLGIAIVNDFKSIEGDRAMGLNSLPVAFGVDGAKYICAASVSLTQLGVAGYLYYINEPMYALILLGLLLPQVYFQATLLLPDPINNDVKYQASAQPFLVFGILATCLCLGHHEFPV